MPEVNHGRSTRSKRVLCALGFLQIVLGVVLLFLWVDQKDQGDIKTAKLFGIVTAASNLLSGCTGLAVGIGASDTLSVLGKGSAVISCLCSIIALGVQSPSMDTAHHDSNLKNPELVIIPLICFVMNILEILCYTLLSTDHHQLHIIPESRIGVFQVPENGTNCQGRNAPDYGSFTTVDVESYQRQSQRPPAYSDPPTYTSIK